MKNLFSRKEVFSIRKFSMGAVSVMIAASLLVTPQTEFHVLKAKENIEVQANKDINIRVLERDGGAVIELAATKDLIDIDVNVMLNGNRVASYHIASIKAGQKIEKKVTKEQLETIKKLISNGQKTLPNTAIVERSASQTISIGGNTLRVEVKYHVEDNTVPEAKPIKPVENSEQPKPEVKPTPEKPEEPKEEKPKPEVQPEKPVERPNTPKPEEKPTPEKPEEPKEEKPKPEVQPEKPIETPNTPKPEVKPMPEKPEEPKEEKPKPEEKPTPDKPAEEDDVETLDGITAKVMDSTGKILSNVPFRLYEYDGSIPNLVKQSKTGEDGTLTLMSNQLRPNKKYELRIEKRDSAFNRENVIFNTDDDGDIVSIDNKIITADSTGIIEFKEERKNDNEIKTVKSYYKVVDEKGNPVENVELSVNGIRTKITTLKNARSNKDGIVELDLEKKVNGVDYIVNVSKNDQFNWEFKPDSVNLNVSENGVITYNDSEGKYTLTDYNGTKIPVFVVKRVDLNYLKTDLTNKIKEAEVELEKASNKELNDIVTSAKEELAKTETLPIYVKGYIDNLTTALNKIKESKIDKKTVKKGEIPEILVRNGREPELREITFEFVNKKDSTDKVEVTSSNGSLTNIELTVGAEYIIKVKGKDNQVLPGSLEIKEEDGNFVPYKAGTDEFYDSIDLGELKKEDKPKEDLSKIRGELEKLVSRELRTEKGYIANEGNQPANNTWIDARTEAEKVLKNSNATKEQLEAAISNLTEKTNAAIVGSEKTKVKKLIVSSNKDNEDKLKLRAELNRVKTIEEVNAVAEKVGGKVTPTGGNNMETKPEKTEGSNAGTTPEKPKVPGKTKPDNPKNESTLEKPKTEDGNIVAIKEAIVTKNLSGKGGLLLFDVEVKNTDVNKVGLVAYRDGVKTENVTIDKFLTESTNKVSYTITVPKNEINKDVKYKFVVTVDGAETNKYLEKTQEAFDLTPKS